MTSTARYAGLILFPLLFVGAIGAGAQPVQPTKLDLAGMSITFREDFDSLSVSPHGPNTRWIAHTPWNGDFGDARFADPVQGFPFTIENGMLRIEARKGADGKWESGLLCSADANGRGFSQLYGYFEMRAKLPKGPGVWPAFWLNNIVDKEAPAGVEIDVLEYYGHARESYEASMHVWYKNKEDDVKEQMKPYPVKVPRDLLTDGFNTFGVMVDREWITYYLNRNEVLRVKTPAEYRRPSQVLLNLALGPGFPLDKTPNPSYMFVDYVHVYALRSN